MKAGFILLCVVISAGCAAQQPTPYKCADGKWGYSDTAARKTVVSCKYDAAYDFSDGLARVRLGKKYGMINAKGVEVMRPEYDAISECDNGALLVKTNGKYTFTDRAGKQLSGMYDDAAIFSEGLAPVVINGKWGFINKQYKMAIAPRYNIAWGFVNNRAAVKLNGKWGYIDTKGTEVIPLIYDEVSYFSYSGKAHVVLNDKKTDIDTTGKELK